MPNRALLAGLLLALTLSLTLLPAGCPPTSLGGENAGAGVLRLLITDKPYPVDLIALAEITITRIEVRRAGPGLPSENDNAANENDNENQNENAANANDNCSNANDNCSNANDNCSNDNDNCFNCNFNENDNENAANCNENSADENLNGDDGGRSNNERGNGRKLGHNHRHGDEEDESDDDDHGFGVDGFDDEESGDAHDEFDEENENFNGTDPARPFLTIFSGARTFNLLDLRNGQTDLLADVEIPAGTYTQMRLTVSGGRVILIDGSEFNLRVPSGEQSGIKLNFTFEVADGEETTLLLDVDLSRAFQAIPGGHIDDPSQIRAFRFQPAFGMRLIDLVNAGSIAGNVMDSSGVALADVLVTAYLNGVEIATTSSAPDGTFRLIGLLPGTCTLEFSAPAALEFDDLVLPDIVVSAGEQTAGIVAVLTPSSPE